MDPMQTHSNSQQFVVVVVVVLTLETGKLLLNYVWVAKIQEQKNPCKTRLLQPDAKAVCGTIIIKVVCLEHKNRQTDPQSKEKGPGTDSQAQSPQLDQLCHWRALGEGQCFN